MGKNFLDTIMPSHSSNERSLIAAYRKLRARLGRYSLSHSEEDALNDACCQLWVGNYHTEGEDEGERLLYQSMRRRQISLWRSGKRHPQTSLEDAQIAETLPETDAEDTYRQIWKLIETELTPLQQDILKRHDMEDDSYSEIAKTLGMQEAAVRMQLSRARKKIRETYLKLKNKS